MRNQSIDSIPSKAEGGYPSRPDGNTGTHRAASIPSLDDRHHPVHTISRIYHRLLEQNNDDPFTFEVPSATVSFRRTRLELDNPE
jgi:hypothetical protein